MEFQVYNVSSGGVTLSITITRRILQVMHCRLCDARCQEARLSLGMRAYKMGSSLPETLPICVRQLYTYSLHHH